MRIQKMKLKKENETNFKFKTISHLKKCIPKNQFIYFIQLLIKFEGLIIQSHLMDETSKSNKSDFSVAKFLRRLCLISNSTLSTINIYNYDAFCFVGYAMCLAPLLFLFLARRFCSGKNKKQKLLTWSAVFLCCSLVLFSQHLVELFFFIFYQIYSKSQFGLREEDKSTLNTFNSNLLLSQYFYIAVNAFMIIYLNIITYIFLSYINEPLFSSSFLFKVYNNKKFIFMLALCINFQGIQNGVFFLANTHLCKLALTLLSLAYIGLILFCYNSTFFPQNKIVFHCVVFVFYDCLVSDIMEIILYALHPNGLKSKGEVLFKIFSEVLLSFLLMRIGNFVKRKVLTKKFSLVMFSKQKIYSIDPLLMMTYCLCEEKEKIKNLKLIMLLIQTHQDECKDSMCSCNQWNLESIVIKAISIKSNEEENKNFCIEHINQEILIWMENEIKNIISNLPKQNFLKHNFHFLILYIEFLSFFHQKFFLCAYLVEQYIKKTQDDSFEIKNIFYILKQKILKQFDKVKHAQLSKERNSKQRLVLNLGDVLSYHQTIQKIQLCLFENCLQLENLLLLQSFKQKSEVSFEKISNMCKDINTSYEEMIRILTKNFSLKNKLQNEQLCYLLTHYFDITAMDMPYEVKSRIKSKISHCADIQEKSLTYFEKNMTHPLIVSIEEKKIVIKYICGFLSDYLEYDRGELIGKDINIFLPKEFASYHKHAILNAVLMEVNSLVQKSVFVINKSGYVEPVRFTATFIPSFKANLTGILNLIETIDNQNYMILDEFTNILSYSRNLENQLGITKEILMKLKFTFLNFFNLNESTLKDFHNEISCIKNKAISDVKQYMKILKKQSVNDELMQRYSQISKDEIKKEKFLKKKIQIRYDMRKLKESFEKIINCVLEAQMDYSLIENIKEISLNMNTGIISPISPQATPDRKHEMILNFTLSSIENMPYFIVRVTKINSKGVFKISRISPHSKIESLIRKSKPNVPFDKKSKTNMKKVVEKKSLSNLNNSSISSFGSRSMNMNSVQNLISHGSNYLGGDFLQKNLNATSRKIKPKKTKTKLQKLNSNTSKNKGLFNTKCTYTFFYLGGLSFVLVICASFYYFYFIKETITELFDSFYIIYYNLMIRGEIIYTSSSVMSFCLLTLSERKDELETTYKEKLRIVSSEFITSFQKYRHYIYKAKNADIVNEFEARDSFRVLQRNWRFYQRESTLEEELMHYHYYTDSLALKRKTNECHMINFLSRKYIHSPEQLEQSSEASDDDFLFFYIIENLMTSITTKIDRMSLITSKVSEKQKSDTRMKVALYFVSFFVVWVFLVVVFLKEFLNFQNKIIQLVQLILRRKNDTYLITKLSLLKSLIRDFQYEKCREIEDEAKLRSLQDEDLKKLYANSTGSFGQVSSQEKERKIDQMLPNYKIEDTIINSSIFNRTTKSMNKPSDATGASKEKGCAKESEVKLDEIMISKSKLFSLSKIFALCGIFLCLTSFSIHFSFVLKETIKFALSSNMAYNYIEKGPNLAELSLYYQISIILQDPFFIIFPKEKYEESTLFNWYHARMSNISSLFDKFGGSKYSFLYYKAYINFVNIRAFFSQNKKGVIPLTRQTDLFFNTRQFCFVMPIMYYQNVIKCSGALEFFSKVNKMTRSCMKDGGGLTAGGWLGVNSLMFNVYNSLYMDFIAQINMKEQIKLMPFLGEKVVKNLFYAVDFPIHQGQQCIDRTVLRDMENLYKEWNSSEKLTMLFNLIFFVIYILLMFSFLQKVRGVCTSIQMSFSRLKALAEVSLSEKETE